MGSIQPQVLKREAEGESQREMLTTVEKKGYKSG